NIANTGGFLCRLQPSHETLTAHTTDGMAAAELAAEDARRVVFLPAVLPSPAKRRRRDRAHQRERHIEWTAPLASGATADGAIFEPTLRAARRSSPGTGSSQTPGSGCSPPDDSPSWTSRGTRNSPARASRTRLSRPRVCSRPRSPERRAAAGT